MRAGGKWERICFEDGTIRLGFQEVPHELGVAGDKHAIRDLYIAQGRNEGTATRYAGQVLEFYQAGEDTLWIKPASLRASIRHSMNSA